jgi:hypothetical protein
MKNILMLLAGLCLAVFAEDITVTLKPNNVSGDLLVSFGLPLPPGHLSDTARVAVFDGSTEIAAYAGQLVPWRGIFKGYVRSALIQFRMNFATSTTTRTVTVKTNVLRTRSMAKTPVDSTCQSAGCTEGPDVWALLPADWLCRSWVAGPQLPSSLTPAAYTGYEQWADRYFPGILSYDLAGSGGEPWLYDRVSTLYKLYVRRGVAGTNGEAFLKEAFRSAHLYRAGVSAQGCFIPKGCDGKYSYTEAPALHYLLWGDERFKTTIQNIAAYHTSNATRLYRVGSFWTERSFAFNWMAFLHAWEILGRSADSTEMASHLDAAVSHQDNPPDGLGPDGSWRHWIDDHDASEGTNVLGASPWMTSLLIDDVVKQFFLTYDARCPAILRKWARYAADVSIVDGTNGAETWYYSTPDSLVGRTATYGGQSVTLQGNIDGSWEEHDWEFVYMLAAGYWAGNKTDAGLLSAIGPLYNAATGIGGNSPPRHYQWSLRNSSQFLWFLDANTPPPSSFSPAEHVMATAAADPELSISPNPACGGVPVRFQWAGKIPALSIYDVSGKLITVLDVFGLDAGSLIWKPGNIRSGLYIARLKVAGKIVTKPFLLVK